MNDKISDEIKKDGWDPAPQNVTIHKSKIWRQGNSLVITIPVEVKETMRLREGDKVLMGFDGEKFCVCKDRS